MFGKIGAVLRTALAVALVTSVVAIPPVAVAAPGDPWAVEWARPVSDDVGSPEHVAVASDGSYYVSGDYNLAKYAQDGSLLWTLDPGMWEGDAPSAVACDDDFVYMTLASGWLFKFDASDGAYVWDIQIPTWDGGWPTSVPKLEVYDGAVWVQNVDGTSILQLDSENGDLLGAVPIADSWSWFEMGGIEVDDDAVYLGLDDDGDSSYRAFGRFGVKETIWWDMRDAYGDPALAPLNAALYAPNDVYSRWDPELGAIFEAHIVAFGPADGTVIDDFVLPDPYANSPALSLDCDADGAIYAVIPSTNEVIKLSQGGGPEEPPVLEEKTIDNGIVKFTVWPSGTPAAYVWSHGSWVYQYYSEDSWGTVLLLDEDSYSTGYRGGNEYFTPVSNEIEILDGGKRIVTVYDAGDSGVRVTQTVTLMDGDRYVTKSWKVENLGGETFQHVRLYHGGDTYFGGDDSASAYYDPTKSMIYLRNEEFTDWGIMGFYANPATPASHFFGGNYSTGNDYAEDEVDLPDTADDTFQDAGYYLQWDTVPLSAGTTWFIQAYEVWTPGGPLQVLAPGSQNVLAGSTVVLPFTLHNIGEVPQEIVLSAESDDPAWDVEVIGDTTPDVGALDRIPVAVRVTVPADATDFANITLHADGPETNGSGSTRLTIAEADFTIEPTEAVMYTRPGGTAEQNIVITNNGDEPLKTGWVTVSDPDNFNNGEGGGSQIEIAPGDNANFRVYFNPAGAGVYPCTVYIPITSPLLVTATVQLTGIVDGDVQLTYLAGPGGTIEGETIQTIDWESDGTTVTAVPDPGHVFVEWSDGLTTPERRDLAVSDDMTVTANFEIIPVQLSYLAGPGGTIEGEATQVIDWGSDGSAVTAVPDPGYSFTGWSDGLTSATRRDMDVQGDLEVTANFAAIPVRLSYLAGPGGTIEGQTTQVIDWGSDGSAVTAVPNPGYRFVQWSDGLTTPERRDLDVQADLEVTATFESEAVEPQEPDLEGIAGEDRYMTAIEISRSAFPDGSESVVLATGALYPDAVSGSALAGTLDCPILLTRTDVLPSDVVAEIERLGAKQAYVLGGTGAVSPAVFSQLVAMLGEGNVRRIGGVDRYGTSVLVGAEVVRLLGDDFEGSAFVATGEDFSDAIASSPLAAANHWPVYLAQNPLIAAGTIDAMRAAGVERVYLLGGEGAVRPATELAVKSAGFDVQRIGGKDRYETAARVATFGVEDAGMVWDGVALATGEDFADALTGGAAQARSRSVMLLTRSAALPDVTGAALGAAKGEITTIRIFGGTGAISQTVRDQVKSIVAP